MGSSTKLGFQHKACISLLGHFLFGRLLMQLTASRDVSSKNFLRRTLNQYDKLRARWPCWSALALLRHVVRQETRNRRLTIGPLINQHSVVRTHSTFDWILAANNNNGMPAIATSAWHSNNIGVISGMLDICSPKGVQTGNCGGKGCCVGER